MNLIIQNVIIDKNKYPIYENNGESIRYFYFLSKNNLIIHKKNLVVRIEIFNSGECRTDIMYKNNKQILEIWENLKNHGRHIRIIDKKE